MASSISKGSKGKNKSTEDNWLSNLDYDDVLSEIKSYRGDYRGDEGEVVRFQDFVRTSYIEPETVVEKYKSFLGKAAKASPGQSADNQRRVQNKMRETAVTQLFAELGYGPKPTVIEQSDDPIESLFTRLRVPALGSLTSGEPSGSADVDGDYEQDTLATGLDDEELREIYLTQLAFECLREIDTGKISRHKTYEWAKDRITHSMSHNRTLFNACSRGLPEEPTKMGKGKNSIAGDPWENSEERSVHIARIADFFAPVIDKVVGKEMTDRALMAVDSRIELSSHRDATGAGTHADTNPVQEKRMSLTESEAVDPRFLSIMPMVSPAEGRAMLLHPNASRLLTAFSIPRPTGQVTVPIPGPEWRRKLTHSEVIGHLIASAKDTIRWPPPLGSTAEQDLMEMDIHVKFLFALGGGEWGSRTGAACRTIDLLRKETPRIWKAMRGGDDSKSDADESAHKRQAGQTE